MSSGCDKAPALQRHLRSRIPLQKRPRVQELARFLRVRRSRLIPTTAELSLRRNRRVVGLTREEVAQRAGVSFTWYSWLEMGREVRATPSTLVSIARALELNEDETAYLLIIAGDPASDVVHRTNEADASMFDGLVDAFRDGPALVVNRRWDVQASNHAARALYGFRPSVDLARNVLFRLVRDPSLRTRYEDPDRVLEIAAAIVRFNYADDPDNSELRELVDALAVEPRFSDLWNRYAVRTFASFSVSVRSEHGRLAFQYVALPINSIGRDTLVVNIPLGDHMRQSAD